MSGLHPFWQFAAWYAVVSLTSLVLLLALAWDAPVHLGDCECAWCEDDRRRNA